MMLLKPSIQAFLMVAESPTLSAAAVKMGLTQTAMTQRIKAVESELGVSLFLRSRKGMALTSEGEALYRHCQDIRGMEGQLLSTLQAGGADAETDFVITGPSSLISGRFLPQCRHVFKNWPKLNISFLIDSNANRLAQLKRGIADLAIVLKHEVTNELDSKLIRPFEFILVATAKWRDRKLKDILENERLFSYRESDQTGFDYLRQAGLLDDLKRRRVFVNDNQALLSLLQQGLGFAALPRELAEPLLESGDLIQIHKSGKPLKTEMALVWYPRREMPDYFKEIVKSLK
jgi:LysR family transcriptional regulator (chromosome initiation inhibitor)